jgi:DNA-binding YbaB/EbfC family protein
MTTAKVKMNFTAMMKKAQEMQKKMQDMQDSLANITEEGTAGAGMVNVTMNGKNEIKKISISDELMNVNEKDMLEDLLIAAINDAKRKIDARAAAEMEKVTGGLGLPAGMKLPF